MDTFFVLWSDEPFFVLCFFGVLLIAAYKFATRANVRVVQKPALKPLDKLSLDATARFPPRAQDRRAS